MKTLKFKKQYKALILDVDGTLIPNKRNGMPSKKVIVYTSVGEDGIADVIEKYVL